MTFDQKLGPRHRVRTPAPTQSLVDEYERVLMRPFEHERTRRYPCAREDLMRDLPADSHVGDPTSDQKLSMARFVRSSE